jgi:hypothetical protein
MLPAAESSVAPVKKSSKSLEKAKETNRLFKV